MKALFVELCLYFMDIQVALSMELLPVIYGHSYGNIHGNMACIIGVSYWHYPWIPVFYGHRDGSIHGIIACI